MSHFLALIFVGFVEGKRNKISFYIDNDEHWDKLCVHQQR